MMEQIEKEFYSFYDSELQKIKNNYKTFQTNANKNIAKDYASKFPFLRRKSELPYLSEILTWDTTKEKFDYETKIAPLLNHWIPKITGIYKHGQTDKTKLCNLRIISNVRLGFLSIAISKNTLSAKEQWEERLISDLKKELPGKALKDYILIVSSKKNDLDGNATHCKNIDKALSAMMRGNFKIIFVCSNNTRVRDIITLLTSYEGISVEKRLLIDIQMDEAHNREEGIPSKREFFDNIIMNPYVKSFVPVSASYEPLVEKDHPLWQKENLDRYAIDYTKNSKTLSTSENYSSISDAKAISFEKLKAHPFYKEHGVVEFDEDTFEEADIKVYPSAMDAEVIKEDKIRRRQMEFCHFMAHEKEAFNLGMNILDNFCVARYSEDDVAVELPMILAGVPNFHIITTPCRVAFTIQLIKYALTKEYSPICIGLYRGGIHIRYKNRLGQIISTKFSDFDENTASSQELNNKIHEIIAHTKRMGESVDRPVIIMGNYKPTGESITFVNFKYGTIRSDTLLHVSGQNREMNYQGFLRCCYMTTKFLEHNPNFKMPVKFIFGSQSSIDDALNYEKENDERIRGFSESPSVPLIPEPTIPSGYVVKEKTKISIPMKITILDSEDELYLTYRELLNKPRHSEDEKETILRLIKQMIDKGAAECSDPEGKFDWSSYKIKVVRCWRKHSQEEIDARKRSQGDKYKPFEADSRFSKYHSKHTNKMPYINEKGKMNVKDCDFLAAYDKYEYEGFVNHKTCIWISYRFE
jgi:hypothetical protein